MLVFGVAIIGIVQLSASATDIRDCDTNSIINCGAFTSAEFTQKFTQNQTGDLPAIYAHYGINPAAIVTAKEGMALRDGTVIVDGKVVATNAMSLGREAGANRNPLTIAGKTYYETASSAIFQSDIPAFVFFDANGKFVGAILKSCSNPLRATPTPVPAAACTSLVVTPISRSKYTLTATASAVEGATITGWHFVVKNSAGTALYDKTTPAAQPSTTIDIDQPGTYTAQVIVNTSIGDKTAQECTKQIVINHAPAAACESLATSISNRTNYTLTGRASVQNGATISGYIYVIKRADGTVVLNKTVSTAALSSSVTGILSAGTYTAQVTVQTSLGNITDTKCQTQIAIQVENCTVPGKETLPKDSPDCYENCLIPGKESFPVNSPECKTVPPVVPPVSPPELPKTGLGDGIGTFAGVGSIVGAGLYYAASRRNLLDAFMQR